MRDSQVEAAWEECFHFSVKSGFQPSTAGTMIPKSSSALMVQVPKVEEGARICILRNPQSVLGP